MAFSVTLTNYVPPPRYDGVVYNRVRIEEATLEAGPWTVIDTQALSPLDTDASDPVSREITTTKAAIEQGFYRVRWLDAANNETPPSAGVQHLVAGGSRPSVAEVANLLRARTKVLGGKELGTFTEDSRPSADEVDGLIDDALDDVLGKVQRPEVPGSAYERRVRGAVKLYAAILVETSYFPEQVKSGQSAVTTYENLYKSRIRALIAEGETGTPQGEGGEGVGSSSPGDAAWTFPANVGGMIGWRSRW